MIQGQGRSPRVGGDVVERRLCLYCILQRFSAAAAAAAAGLGSKRPHRIERNPSRRAAQQAGPYALLWKVLCFA